jgi:hypothetical protein
MAESGVASLSDEQSRELARVAAEQLGDREFELEMYRDLPPAMQPGGIYSLLSDVGRSRKGLSYHTYGHMPKELEKSYNKLLELYQSTVGEKGSNSPEAKTISSFIQNQMPFLHDSDATSDDIAMGNVFGFFQKGAIPPEKAPYIEKLAKKYGVPARKKMYYGSGKEQEQMLEEQDPRYKEIFKEYNQRQQEREQQLGLSEYELPTEPMTSFYTGRIGDPLPPSFLTNPSESEGPSVSLSRYNIPKNMSLRGDNSALFGMPEDETFWHELFHAGANDPRLYNALGPKGEYNKDYYAFSPAFRALPEEEQVNIKLVLDRHHMFTGPVQEYRGTYFNLQKLFTPEMFQMMEQNKEEFSEEEIAKYEEIKRMRDAGLDYIHPLAKERLDKDDLEKVNIYEKASNFLRTFLNETSDLTTGEKKGYLYYPETSKPRVTSP